MRRLVLIPLTLLALEPGRLLLMGLGLRKLRKSHPQMFDGAAAAESVRQCILADAHEYM